MNKSSSEKLDQLESLVDELEAIEGEHSDIVKDMKRNFHNHDKFNSLKERRDEIYKRYQAKVAEFDEIYTKLKP